MSIPKFVDAWNAHRHEVRAELAAAGVAAPVDIVRVVGRMLWSHRDDSGVVTELDHVHELQHGSTVTYQFATNSSLAYVVRFWVRSDLFYALQDQIVEMSCGKPDKPALDMYMEFARQVIIHLRELPLVVETGYIVERYSAYDEYKRTYWRADYLDYTPFRGDATVFLTYVEADNHVHNRQTHTVVPVDRNDEVLR